MPLPAGLRFSYPMRAGLTGSKTTMRSGTGIPKAGSTVSVPCAQRGPVPSAGQVARITISAAYDGQTRLGIPLFEISNSADAQAPALELVSDPAGGIRLAIPPGDAGTGSRPLLANERTPTLLAADPPALKGEPRFELTFTLDREKQLRVTARDLVTGMLVKKDAPVHRLT